MAFSDKDVLTAARGSIFMAEAETAIPAEGVKSFTITSDTVDTGWKNIGYLSSSTLPSVSTDGGDSTTQAVWQNPNFRTTYAATTGTITFTGVQTDADTMAEMFYGKKDEDGGVVFSLSKKEQKKALFVLFQDDNGERSGMYIPNTSVAYSTLPTPSTDDFTSYEIVANILSSSSLVHDDDDRQTAIKWYDSSAFKDE